MGNKGSKIKLNVDVEKVVKPQTKNEEDIGVLEKVNLVLVCYLFIFKNYTTKIIIIISQDK